MNILLLYFFYSIMNLNSIAMDNCYAIKSQEYLFDIIQDEKLDILTDGKSISKFRSTRGYYLKNGGIVIIVMSLLESYTNK